MRAVIVLIITLIEAARYTISAQDEDEPWRYPRTNLASIRPMLKYQMLEILELGRDRLGRCWVNLEDMAWHGARAVYHLAVLLDQVTVVVCTTAGYLFMHMLEVLERIRAMATMAASIGG